MGVSRWGEGGKNCFGDLGDFGREGACVRTEWDVEDHAGGKPPAWHPGFLLIFQLVPNEYAQCRQTNIRPRGPACNYVP